MSDLFSQFVSMMTPKYVKVNTQETEILHDNMMQKNHFRATMCAEDRARFFPGPNGSTPITTTEDTRTSSPTSTEEDRASPPTPTTTEEEKASPPTPTEDQTRTSLPTPPTVTGFNNLWDVALSEDEDEHVYQTIDEVKRLSNQQKAANESLALPAEKSRPQIGDIFPNINEILMDHGIKEKLRDLTITVKNKLQKETEPSIATEDTTETKDQLKDQPAKESIFSNITLPQPPSFISRTNSPQKMVPLQQSKDKTVQTYFPKELR